VDPSSLIFVALAVAWAVYLVPKALRHHDDAVRSRSVDRFSHTMRVLARREVVTRRNARLVVGPRRPESSPIVTSKVTTKRVPIPARTPAAQAAPVSPDPAVVASVARSTARAARRRRRVLGLILTTLVAVGALAAFGVTSRGYVAIPAGLLVAWLVACRLMVRQERGLGLPVRRPRAEHMEDDAAAAPDDIVAEEPAADIDPLEDTTSTPAIVDPSLWDPMPVTLPTYVSKPAATRRTVRTIDLDSTGVWTSGRTESDARLARDADAAARAARTAEDDARRATGS
jgi:hypothetical protein